MDHPAQAITLWARGKANETSRQRENVGVSKHRCVKQTKRILQGQKNTAISATDPVEFRGGFSILSLLRRKMITFLCEPNKASVLQVIVDSAFLYGLACSK
jgi:hypothetical protein